MHNSKFKISFLAIATLCLLWGPVGCGGDEESTPAQPEVVTTKIKASAPKAKKPAAQAPAQTAKPATMADAGDKPAGSPEGDEASIQKTMEDIKKEAAAGTVTRYRARLYNPEGKTDPFEDPFKKQTTQAAVEKEPDSDEPDRIRQTPLERIDLGQLTLVGVIKFASGYKAIVEEASGKGYMIKVGTYIGINYGQVTKIQSDRITIQEKVKDVLGKYIDQTSQLKLQKPLGEN
ncbi:MAG: pilus assembly protein PilP [Desulfobacterales bacterium]|nr:pilus assembly protein PilP [Desulfobacterales bacterium]